MKNTTKTTAKENSSIVTLSEGYSWIKINGTDSILTPNNKLIDLEQYNNIMSLKSNKIDFQQDEDGNLLNDYKTSNLDYVITYAKSSNNTIKQNILFYGINKAGELELVEFSITKNTNSQFINYRIFDLKSFNEVRYVVNNSSLLTQDDIATFYNTILDYLLSKGFSIDNKVGEFEDYTIYKFIDRTEIYRIIFKDNLLSNIKFELDLNNQVEILGAKKDINKDIII